MEKFSLKGHGSMLLANVSWGLMSPLAKVVMAGGVVTPLVLTYMRIFGAMVLKEPVTGKKVAGIALGACGALMLILGSGAGNASAGDARHVAGDLQIGRASCRERV